MSKQLEVQELQQLLGDVGLYAAKRRLSRALGELHELMTEVGALAAQRMNVISDRCDDYTGKTLIGFSAAYEGQDCPPALQDYDTEGDWDVVEAARDDFPEVVYYYLDNLPAQLTTEDLAS